MTFFKTGIVSSADPAVFVGVWRLPSTNFCPIQPRTHDLQFIAGVSLDASNKVKSTAQNPSLEILNNGILKKQNTLTRAVKVVAQTRILTIKTAVYTRQHE